MKFISIKCQSCFERKQINKHLESIVLRRHKKYVCTNCSLSKILADIVRYETNGVKSE